VKATSGLALLGVNACWAVILLGDVTFLRKPYIVISVTHRVV
jgi:hypothetical protein